MNGVSVIVPVRDEQDNVVPLCRELEAVLASLDPYEIVFVDDGSRDATASRLAALAQARLRVRVLHHARRFGQSTALRSGVLAAHHPWIATIDGDGQNDPADLPALLREARAAVVPTLCVGHRVQRRDSLSKRWASRFANRLRGGLLKDGTPDTGCGLKVLPRELYLRLPWFDHQHRFLPALVLREGGRVVSLPVRHRPRIAGRSKYGNLARAVAGAWDLLGVAWLIRRAPRGYAVSEDSIRRDERAA